MILVAWPGWRWPAMANDNPLERGSNISTSDEPHANDMACKNVVCDARSHSFARLMRV